MQIQLRLTTTWAVIKRSSTFMVKPIFKNLKLFLKVLEHAS